MEPHVSADLTRANHRTVFIYLTAGDGGLDENYWKSRESAALSSIRYRLASLRTDRWLEDSFDVAGHQITRYQTPDRGIQSYHLRLPDGNMAGTGWTRYGKESLARLHEGKIDTIRAVDGSTRYAGWHEVVNTVEAVAINGMDGAGKVIIHHPEWEPQHTPHDHNDHRKTGQCVRDGGLPGIYECWAYQGYNISSMPGELTPEELFWKTGMFVAYDKEMLDRTGKTTIAEDQMYLQWCRSRPCYRVLEPPGIPQR